ncbi:MAG: sulfatase-like hydrolase/transferase [Verrucomicrobia bacterium]|nr:sulfatase-like hydrolase/transferase [Verrucomicrobiota bacterium]
MFKINPENPPARLICILSIFITVFFISAAHTAVKPNVVIVLIDNHGYHELSRNGHPVVQTPRIDRLSRTGVNFTDFNAPPFCSPSRGALLTGRYALRYGIHNTVGGVSILHRDERTLADVMKSAGYRTAVFGKWHLGMSHPYTPDCRGFDEYFIHGGGGVSQLEDYYGNNHMDATYIHQGQYVKSRGFSTDVLFDQGIDFMNRNRETPFFCLISTPAVHFPTLLHPETGKRLKDRGITDEKQLPLWSMIENVDENVGRLLDYLKASGLKENTVLFLMSDQGVNDRGVTHRAGAGTRRGVQYDEKHQVYCMVQYPKITDAQPGDRSELTGMVDVLPTVLDVCGIEPPSNLDGQSMRPLLAHTSGWNGERKLIIQCPRARERSKWGNLSVKYKKWRLVDGKELYDIRDDHGQTRNLIDQYPRLVKALTASYETFWSELPPQSELLSAHVLGAEEAPSVRLNAMDWYEGGHPWPQQALAKRKEQGKWRVDMARSGLYRFELRHYPREEPRPAEAVKASVIVGNHSRSTLLDVDATHAVLELKLEKGLHDLYTVFQRPDDHEGNKEWGAYYVYVDYQGE